MSVTRVLAGLARGKMKAKHAALIEALTGRFDAHHGELARMLLDQIDGLNIQIDKLTTRIEALIAAIPAAGAPGNEHRPNDGAHTDAGAGTDEQAPTGLAALQRLAEVPGIGPRGAQVILAEIGLDMTRFPTAGHLASWTKLCPRTIQSGAKSRSGKTGKGNPYL